MGANKNKTAFFDLFCKISIFIVLLSLVKLLGKVTQNKTFKTSDSRRGRKFWVQNCMGCNPLLSAMAL